MAAELASVLPGKISPKREQSVDSDAHSSVVHGQARKKGGRLCASAPVDPAGYPSTRVSLLGFEGKDSLGVWSRICERTGVMP